MEEVIEYLRLKNDYYEKFLSITAKFLSEARQNRWDDLDFFVENRERILNIIRSFELKIAKVVNQKPNDDAAVAKYKPTVKSLLEQRKALADKIVALDLELISKIDEMKSETIKDLKKTVETGHQLNSFTRVPGKTKTTKEV